MNWEKRKSLRSEELEYERRQNKFRQHLKKGQEVYYNLEIVTIRTVSCTDDKVLIIKRSGVIALISAQEISSIETLTSDD